MRAIGFVIVGAQVGIVWGSWFARHGHPYSSSANWVQLAEAFVVYTILVFAPRPR